MARCVTKSTAEEREDDGCIKVDKYVRTCEVPPPGTALPPSQVRFPPHGMALPPPSQAVFACEVLAVRAAAHDLYRLSDLDKKPALRRG